MFNRKCSSHLICYHLFLCLSTAGKSKHCDLFFNGRCYQKRHGWFKYYDARNNCTNGGGDLASFETLSDININVSLKNLSLISSWVYWIGLQKNEWRWEDTGLPLCLSLCFSGFVSVSLFFIFSLSFSLSLR